MVVIRNAFYPGRSHPALGGAPPPQPQREGLDLSAQLLAEIDGTGG